MKLFLDDIRNPTSEGWTIVRNYVDFINCIEKQGLPDVISFDHDLGEDEAKEKVFNGISKRRARAGKKLAKSGYDCAKWLLEYCHYNDLELPKILVHSMNPVGRENILKLFKLIE